MESKNIVPAESSKDSETAPLVVDEKEAVATSLKANSVATLASDLSELSLQYGGKVTSTSRVGVEIAESPETAVRVPSSNSEDDQSGASTDVEQSETDNAPAQEIAIQVPSSNSEEDKSGASTDVEQSETEITDSQETALITDSFETAVQALSSNSRSGASTDVEQSATAGISGSPTREPQSVRETGSPRSSSTDPEIMDGNRRFFDHTMWWLLIDIFMLCFPVYGAYCAFRYASDCVDGDRLPLLLILASSITILFLVGRIARNVTKKFSRLNENEVVPKHIIFVGDILQSILYTALMAYFSIARPERCSFDLHSYVFFYGIASICLLSIIHLKKYLNRGTQNRINFLRG